MYNSTLMTKCLTANIEQTIKSLGYAYFTKGDLVLIGSNLPHCGLTNENTRNEYEIVVQFLPDFLGPHIWKTPEMKKITNLLDASKGGIVFGESVKKSLESKI